MMAFCFVCGTPLPERAMFCQNCGSSVAQSQNANVPPPHPQPVVYVKPKVPGRGFGISSMVLSIIGLVYAVVLLTPVLEVVDSMYVDSSVFVPLVMFSSLSIIPIPFHIAARNRGYYNGVSKSGLVMGIIGTSIYVLMMVLVAVNL